MGKLINRIPGLHLLISGFENACQIARQASRFDKLLEASPGERDIKRHSPTVVPTKSDSGLILCLQMLR